jgi:zinc transport system substrate-binding protein
MCRTLLLALSIVTPTLAAELRVMTTFHPTAYFAQRIGGDLVTVECPLPAGADPAYWQPPREVIVAYQKADLVILNGADFEKWTQLAALPPSRVVDTAKPLANDFIRIEGATTHSHGKAGEHSHEGIDGHLWLDPENARVQAKEIWKALDRKFDGDEAARKSLATRHAALDTDLAALLADLQKLGAPKGGTFFASHPAYNYLARRLGWRVINLDFDPGEMPNADQLAALKLGLGLSPARYLLWEAEPLPAIAERMKAEFGLESVVIEPGENPGPEALASGRDFLAIQRENVARLANCCEPRGL